MRPGYGSRMCGVRPTPLKHPLLCRNPDHHSFNPDVSVSEAREVAAGAVTITPQGRLEVRGAVD